MPDIASIVDGIHEHAALTGIGYSFGKLPSKENRDHPHIAWVLLPGTIGTVAGPGGRVVGSTRVKQIRTAVQPFAVQCWGAGITEASDLMHAIVLAAYEQVSPKSVQFGSFEWSTQDAGADYAQRGEKLILEVTIMIPVTDDASTLTTLTAQSHSTTWTDDTSGSTEVVC